MKTMLVLALAVVSLAAADATGTWRGTFIVSAPQGGDPDGTAHLVLRQQGNLLTGTAGPNEGEQHAIQNGKAEDGNITFEVAGSESVMRFSLKQEGDEIKGNVSREREGRTETATLAVKRDR